MDTGALRAALSDDQTALARDLRRGMEAAATAVQGDLRSRTRAAGLGPGLEKAWSKAIYPPKAGKNLNPAALVYGKSEVLFPVFFEGATIVPRKGRFLAIPTKEAEAMGFATTNVRRDGKGTGSIPRRLSMVAQAIKQLGERNVRFVPAKRGRMVVLYRKGGRDTALFVLVPQVRLKARMDLNAAQKAADQALSAAMDSALGA